jgi:hypothetical protein
MRFSEIVNEAPRNDPDELKRRTDRSKGVLDKQAADKAKISSRASELGKKGAKQRALNKDLKAFNKDLRKDELEKREREAKSAENGHREPDPQKPVNDGDGINKPSVADSGQSDIDAQNTSGIPNDVKSEIDDTILMFLKQQIKSHKRKRGIEGDQGVEERDVIDFAKHKYPDVDPMQIDRLWIEVKGGSNAVSLSDVGSEYKSGETSNASYSGKDLDKKLNNRRKERSRSNSPRRYQQTNYTDDEELSVGNVISKVSDMSNKDMKRFKDLISNG